MSERNLEVARRFFECARSRDWSQLELLTDGVVYRPMEGFLESDWVEDLTFEGTSFRELGPRQLVSRWRR